MIRRFLLTGLAALLLVGCGEEARAPSAPDTPFLWEVANADGQVEGWLYGTIHALPDGVEWRTRSVGEVVDAADFLVLEVADLRDTRALAAIFTDLARSPGHPPLHNRLPSGQRATLDRLLRDAPYSAEDYRNIETWAAAMILAQAVPTNAESANGVDKALLAEFAGRRVAELEGATRQFAAFDRLAEEDQRALLAAVVAEAQDPAAASRATALWQAGEEAALLEEIGQGMLADPELRQALLTDRNQQWIDRLLPMLAEPGLPLVAVGAAHLVGPDGLPTLLRQRGYRVRRLP